MSKIKWFLLFLLSAVLIYSRFNNLLWGLPQPMHPDERNMANAIQGLNCDIRYSIFDIKKCLNPNFFAYGQFPLYTGYGLILIIKFISGELGTPVGFEEAIFSLRLISAFASILNVVVLLKIFKLIFEGYSKFEIQLSESKSKKRLKSHNYDLISYLIFIFSPFFIQFSHFGTTESLLMFLYSLIVYLSVRYYLKKVSAGIFFFLTALFSGIAIASKVSSVIFLIIPLAVIIAVVDNPLKKFVNFIYFVAITLVFSILFSPHNFITFDGFIGSMNYESDVALGVYQAFYTRQFVFSLPIIFQFSKIFPYVLGWPVFIFSWLGFVFLPYKKEFNILRLAILIGFLPNAFFYAKWTRFISPAFPLLLVTAVLFLVFFFQQINKFVSRNSIFDIRYLIQIQKLIKIIIPTSLCLITVLLILPGLAFLSVYQKPDVRFTASEWIYGNMPESAYILSETANVVDPPFITKEYKRPVPHYEYISFNFYDLDINREIQLQLREHLAKANYIFIPSRRIFANHYCPKNSRNPNSSFKFINSSEKCDYLRKKYPLLNEYYDKLFSGELGFKKIAEFSSFPKIEIFGKTLIEFPDEAAEETWTVFDHPVFRIYKKI